MQDIVINGQTVTVISLPLIFQQFRDSGKPVSPVTVREILETVKVYNPIHPGEEQAYMESLEREYAAFCARQGEAR